MVRFSMEKIQDDAPVDADGEEKPRPWLRAIFSGAVFGGLGAAATHWMAYHSTSLADRGKVSFARNWTSAVVGVASGTVAMYGTLRADDAPTRSVFKDPSDTPDTKIDAASAQHGSVIASPGERSL